MPLPGPQTAAYQSEADETLYGGAAGGGKTYLLLGLPLVYHHQSIIFRREYPQLSEIEDKLDELLDGIGTTNRNRKRWTLPDKRFVELGAVQRERDWNKYKGRSHDYIGFDELTEFTRSQYQKLIIWNRTATPGQRVRVVATTNPPIDEEQMWVVEEWAPWLDEDYADPAEPGEILHYAYGKQDEVQWYKPKEVDEEGRVKIDDKWRHTKTRTFIPARLEDNPHLYEAGYARTLDTLPEVLRLAFAEGDFTVGGLADALQVIPSQWVKAAQDRWKTTKAAGPMSRLGVDPARGGKDNTVLALRYGAFVAELEIHPGEQTPNGPAVAALVIASRKGGAVAVVDVIGVGASVYDFLIANKVPAHAFNSSEREPDATDRSGQLQFVNKRAQWYWHLREMLDPANGEDVCLPPSKVLRRQLCAPRFKLTIRGILIESKDDIIKRLGASPDEADAVVYSFVEPPIPSAGYVSLFDD